MNIIDSKNIDDKVFEAIANVANDIINSILQGRKDEIMGLMSLSNSLGSLVEGMDINVNQSEIPPPPEPQAEKYNFQPNIDNMGNNINLERKTQDSINLGLDTRLNIQKEIRKLTEPFANIVEKPFMKELRIYDLDVMASNINTGEEDVGVRKNILLSNLKNSLERSYYKTERIKGSALKELIRNSELPESVKLKLIENISDNNDYLIGNIDWIKIANKDLLEAIAHNFNQKDIIHRLLIFPMVLFMTLLIYASIIAAIEGTRALKNRKSNFKGKLKLSEYKPTQTPTETSEKETQQIKDVTLGNIEDIRLEEKELEKFLKELSNSLKNDEILSEVFNDEVIDEIFNLIEKYGSIVITGKERQNIKDNLIDEIKDKITSIILQNKIDKIPKLAKDDGIDLKSLISELDKNFKFFNEVGADILAFYFNDPSKSKNTRYTYKTVANILLNALIERRTKYRIEAQIREMVRRRIQGSQNNPTRNPSSGLGGM